jgi:hypothetical protein
MARFVDGDDPFHGRCERTPRPYARRAKLALIKLYYFGTLLTIGSLGLFGTLMSLSSLRYVGTLTECGSLLCNGTLMFTDSF